MNARTNRISDIFLYSFALFLIAFAIIGICTGSEYIEAVASIASVVGVIFTTADFFACVKEGNEKFLDLVDKMSESMLELRALEKLRIHKLVEYCQFKYDFEFSLTKSARTDRECVMYTYKKALDMISPIDEVMDPLLREKELQDLKTDLETDKRKSQLRKLGILRDIVLSVGAMTVFILLYLFESISITPVLPNILTIIGFGSVLFLYALRGREVEELEAAEDFVRETIAKNNETMKIERIRIKQIETVLCENPKILQQDADARLLIFLMYILDANDEADLLGKNHYDYWVEK